MSNQKGQHPNKKGEGKINISNKGNLSNSAIHWSLSMSECEPKFYSYSLLVTVLCIYYCCTEKGKKWIHEWIIVI